MRNALEEVLGAQREVEENAGMILNAESLEEAKQLYLVYQVHCRLYLYYKNWIVLINTLLVNNVYSKPIKSVVILLSLSTDSGFFLFHL